MSSNGKTAGLFIKRLSESKVVIEGATFKVRALPSQIVGTIWGDAVDWKGNQNRGQLLTDYFRHGVVTILDLKDEDGNDVVYEPAMREILGNYYSVVPDRILSGLDFYQVILPVAAEIDKLTHLTEAERRKLDFTSPSDENEPNATPAADAEADVN